MSQFLPRPRRRRPSTVRVANFSVMSFARFVVVMLLVALAAPDAVMAQTRDPLAGLPSLPAPMADATVRDIRVQVTSLINTTIGAPMTGRLERFPLVDGDRFKQGDVLARFDCAERDAALARAKAALQLKRRILNNKQKLGNLGNSTGLEIDVAVDEVAEATADLAVAQAMQANCTVTAPFAGRVSGVSVHPFQFAQLGAPMIDILADHDLGLEMVVPSRWLAWLKPGLAFDVAIDETGRTYPAELLRLSGKVDPVSRSVKAYAKVTNPAEDLLAGMSGRALLSPPDGAR